MQFVAWDGNTYDGSPPVGWTQAADRRWWPEGHKPQPPKGWYPDPTGRYSLRWWDGGTWTAQASSSADTLVNDPLHPPPLSANAPKVQPVADTTEEIDRSAANALVKRARRIQGSINGAFIATETAGNKALERYESARREHVADQINSMPIGRLKDATQGRLRLGAIEKAGYTTVGRALEADSARLQNIRGVGAQTAIQVIAAATQLRAALDTAGGFTLDPDRRSQEQTVLLLSLHRYRAARSILSPIETELKKLASAIALHERDASRSASLLRSALSSSRQRAKRQDACVALRDLLAATRQQELADAAEQIQRVASATPDNTVLWRDYETNAIAYNGLLIELGDLEPDRDAAQGFIPEDIASRVVAQALDTSQLKASLRGYQAFGAKFALAQGNTIIGDEMGLGKTIEALAALSHLASEGATHFLVVCPASVIVNWENEIRRHSRLPSHRLHGASKDRAYRTWELDGGIAIATYHGAGSFDPPEGIDVALLVVDEAHYVKNPEAKRTKSVRRWISQSRGSLFLTGTPMENRVEEFQTLIAHLQPGTAQQIRNVDALVGAASFREVIAPVYLRRNQTDVLDELPERIDTQEWVDPSVADLTRYGAAVLSGNFMAMRQAAFSGNSAKLDRLQEIVEEATANEHKVVVFSYFRGVLDTVCEALGGLAFGQLNGSVSPAARQQLIDEFTASSRPLVLAGQIEAGGVGVNLQAASVVILTEPQWKPSTENQAIARCHRMGQTRPVNVHRLLTTNGVDPHMLAVLARKEQLFDAYVRESTVKAGSPAAIDVSDLQATEDVVNQTEAEARILRLERDRLGLEPGPVAVAGP